MRIRPRSARANTIAEAPAVLYFLFVLIAIPMMCIVTMGLRALFFQFSVRDAVNQAAKCASFTNDNTTIVPYYSSAKTTAQKVFTRDMAAWPGITGSLSLLIVTKAVSTIAAPAPSASSLASVNTNNFIYLIRGTSTGTVLPLVPAGSFLGVNIPGLSGAYPLTVQQDAYVENPTGLVN